MSRRTVRKAGASITIDDTALQQMLARIRSIPDARVGVLTSSSQQYDDGSTTVEIAAYHELGAGVPRRSWLRDWVNPNRREITARLQAAIRSVALRSANPQTEMGRLGAWAVGEIQQRIADGIAPPNAPETIARKGSSKPLIETGVFRTSIAWALEKAGLR